MNSLLLLIICIAVLVLGYIFYGGWLCKQWGVGESNKATPAHEMEDGVDYVPAKAPVLMGHHFSSIAGAGPITGPIGAAMFGWVPVVLWILVGGIFFGGVHDFGALFASIRHKGQSIGEIISTNMGKKSKMLFTTFAYLTLLLVVAAFASIVASSLSDKCFCCYGIPAVYRDCYRVRFHGIPPQCIDGSFHYPRCSGNCTLHGNRYEFPSNLSDHQGMDDHCGCVYRGRIGDAGLDSLTAP